MACPVSIAVALCSLLALGCSFNAIVAGRMAGAFDEMQRAFNREESAAHAREAAPALLKMLDGFVEMAPRNEELLEKAAAMNAEFAFGLIEDEDPARARLLYRRARAYGERALAERDPDLRAALDGAEEPLRARLAALEPGDEAIPALFWTAFAWGGEINLSRGDARAVAELPKVVAVMERLVEIAPAFHRAGPHLFLAVYYGSRGSAVGGDPAKSKAHFDRAAALTGGKFPIVDVLYARFYCVALGEKDPGRARAEFVRALERVRACPIDADPDNRLATAIAKERAARLLPQLDDLILPPLPEE